MAEAIVLMELLIALSAVLAVGTISRVCADEYVEFAEAGCASAGACRS